MKDWFHNWRRRRDLGAELRRSRPEASDRLVRSISARIDPQSRTSPTRRRLGVAAAAAGCTLAVVGATGGFSVAATSVIHATRSVAHATPSGWQTVGTRSAPGGFTQGTPVSFDSACDMYAVAPTVTGISPDTGAPGSVVEVDGTNFTGVNAVTDVQLNGEETSFRVDSSTSLEFVVPDDGGSGPVTVANCKGTATGPSFTVEGAPSITGVSPGDGGYGTRVTISGSGFTGATKVKFNGTNDSTFTVDSDSQITAHVPSGAKTNTSTKPGEIVVMNAVGSSGFAFIVDAGAPTITKFTPGAAQVGTTVKIKGTNFADDSGNSLVSGVSFNGTAATTVRVVSANEVDADVPSGATSGPITVATDVGVTSSSTSFTVVAPTPSIDELDPSYGKAGTTVKIKGSSLTGITQVLFEGSDGNESVSATFTAVSDSLVKATVPRHAVTGPIEVVRPDPSGGPDQTAESGTFTVIVDAPQLASVAPTSGGYGTSVTIDAAAGTTLIGVTAVKFNGEPDPTFTISEDGSSISATVPKHAPVKTLGKGTISVTNAGGTTSIPFDVIGDGPTIRSVIGTLAGGREASVGDPVSITGTNLDTVTKVTFEGGASTTSFIWQDTDLLTVRVPSGADTGKITVVNPDGSATSSTSLTILKSPTILGFSPAYGVSGTKVKIVGEHLSGTTNVYFAGAPARFTVADDNTIDAVVPSNASTGDVEVIVGRRMEADSGNDNFTVVATKPAFTDYSPGSGKAGDTITITGKRFVGPMTVKFGSKKSDFVHVTDSTSLTAKVPSGLSGTVSITVANLAGSVSKSGFAVVAVTSVSPTTTAVGKTVTITGTNFKAGGTPVVEFNGTPATGSDVVSVTNSKIVVTVPAGATSGPVTVTTGSIVVTGPTQVTVVQPPAISSFPASAAAGSRITVTGSNFVDVRWVTVGGVRAAVNVKSPTELRVLVPTSARSGAITVKTIAGKATSATGLAVVR